MSQAVPGRISSIVNIHNPSIEFHPVDRGINTGAAVILVAGGGHNTLNVGTESADFVPFFYNYGVNTVILRNRLRRDGYDVADRRGQRRAAGDPPGARPREGVGTSIRTRSASWASRRAPSCRRRRRCSSRTSTRRTPTPPIRWPACRRGRTSSASSTRGRRRSRGTAPRRRFPRNVPPAFIASGGLGRSRPRDLGDGLLRRDAAARRAEHRDAHLRQRPPPRRRAARRQPA